MSRLSEIFGARNRCFLPFVTAGHPDLETTLEILLQLAGAGSDIIELGVPFSDPVADGPVIQRSSFSALEHGYSLDDMLDVIRQFRSQSDAGIILMSYMNPVYQFGLERLEARAHEVGLDGILISDLTPEEYARLNPFRRLDTIFLAAPTSSDQRLEVISESSRGFLYLVARTGVTGRQTDVSV
jgi:tryptophan synthase alpha chain